MRNSNLILILVPFVFLGCTAISEPELNFDKPEVQIPKKPPEAIKNKGSLYSQRGTSLFADKKDLQVGDIIQIVISEDLTSKSTNKRELSSTRDNSLGGGLFGATGTNVLGGTASGYANKLNSNNTLGFTPDTINIVAKEYASNPRRIIQLFNNLTSELKTIEAKYGKEFIEEHQSLIA